MQQVKWKEINGRPVAYLGGHPAVWAPQPGSQELFLRSQCFETLYEGNRGPGKTDALVMDFVQHVGQGFGPAWRGILFRRTVPQLKDVIGKCHKWLPRMKNPPSWNANERSWTWSTGEKLILTYIDREQDYDNYHGHEYPWIAFEELTRWPDDKCYKIMMTCCRSPIPGMPRKYRATTNPYGVGHNWVMARFQLPARPGRILGRYIEDEETGLSRISIRGDLAENKILLAADPDYRKKIAAGAANPSQKKAWLHGDWNIVAGGMIDDIWDPNLHVLGDIRFNGFPPGWRINRSYDHGQSRPFSVGWWAESNGEPIRVNGRVVGQVPGDIVRFAEWYGWNGVANEGLRMAAPDIASGIIDRERKWGISVQPGPADTSIFDDHEPGKSVAGGMESRGVVWTRADKGPGSREQGWQKLREYLQGALPGEDGTREQPGLFICSRCTQFIRTVPTMPRDDKKLDDVDTDCEDHIGDEVRYRLREKVLRRTSRSWK